MKTFVLFTASWLGCCLPALAQSVFYSNDTFARYLENRYREDSARAALIAETYGYPLYYTQEDGTTIGFSGFSETGLMQFNITTNARAGRTVGTNKVWPGGAVGTSLTGDLSGNLLGIWDGGAVLKTHQELVGRVTQVDGVQGSERHPTHVAGTMIAAGVDADAKGMAYEATLRAYDFNNDESEMAVAANNGMIVSNHSYGQVAGWYQSGGEWFWYGDVTISAVEDYTYGFYDRRTERWDRIAWNNPYYLICKAAGNDRGKKHSGLHKVRVGNQWDTSTATRNDVGPYDCIPGYAVAKNILTVGSVKKISGGWTTASDVVMSSFSGWGPTDDGRIKPDVVSPGEGIRSSVNNGDDEYRNLQGTSMATPVVSGSLFLLQELHHDMYGSFMRSATLKALAIHTADEAGPSPGPDYQYGWGLINTARAAQVIKDSLPLNVQERVLENKQIFIQSLYSDGTSPAKVTICWTDVPGTPVSPSLNPTDLMLVNDLDIRLVRQSDGAVFQPYVLNPAAPQQAATTGDNFRDNVEQIFVAAPTAGHYKLVVSHKKQLRDSASQAYSLIVTGFEPVAPVAGFAPEQLSVCAGKLLQFSDTSLHNPHAWDWRISDGAQTITASSPEAGIVFNTPGTYTVHVSLKVSNYGGADSVEKTFTIEVRERPDVISISGNNKSMAHKEEHYEVPGTSGSTYNWYIENGTVQSGQGTNSVIVKWGNFLSGRVAVQEMNSVLCEGDTALMNVELEWATGIAGIGFQSFSIYPNPASRQVTLAFTLAEPRQVTVSLINLLGQVLYAETWGNSSGEFAKDIDIAHLPAGVYMVRLDVDGAAHTQKLIVE